MNSEEKTYSDAFAQKIRIARVERENGEATSITLENLWT